MPKIRNPASPTGPAPTKGSAPRRRTRRQHQLARLEHRWERLGELLLDRVLANGHGSVPLPEHLAGVAIERIVKVLRNARNSEVAPRLLDQAARDVRRASQVARD